MRFVGIKEAYKIDLQILHRVRSRLVTSRTNLVCQMRCYCKEHGVPIRQGAGVFKIDILRVPDDNSNNLSFLLRKILLDRRRRLRQTGTADRCRLERDQSHCRRR